MAGDREMSAALQDLFAAHMAELTRQLGSGEISLLDWQITMRADIRRAHALQMIAGADGDPRRVEANDWLRLGTTIRSQDGYLEDFARQVLSGEVDAAGATSRAELYAKSAGSEFSRQTLKDVDLPAHPKDGSSECLSNCGCEWRDNGDGSYAWVRSLDDSCETCKRREVEWANYRPESA